MWAWVAPCIHASLPVDREYKAYSLSVVSNTVEIYLRTNPVSITFCMRGLFRLDA